jgi:hypothetical protein
MAVASASGWALSLVRVYPDAPNAMQLRILPGEAAITGQK